MIKKNGLFKIYFFPIFAIILCLPFCIQAAVPANPDANQKTKDLLNWLEGLKNRTENRVVSGMWMGFSTRNLNSAWSEFYDGVYSQSNKHLGLIGIEFEDGWSSTYTDVYYDQAWIDKCVWHWNQGGLITIDWHPHNPFNDGNVNNTSGSGGTNLEQLITPGTALYTKWLAKLDKMAVILQDFENKGTVILWRPFHEMNGSWFWWGSQNNSASYIKLWQHMYNYYTNVKGLDNLLWVYAPNEGSGSLTRYPGDSYTDIVGVDYYPSGVTFGTMTAYTDLKTKNKVIAMTEYGYKGSTRIDNINVINSIQNSNSLCSYIMYWNDYSTYDYAMTSHLNTSGFMNHSWVIDRSEVWGTGNVSLYCGDSSCNNAETCSTCPADCGACPAVIEPAAYWKFDETGGTAAADSSGYGNSGTLYNGPVWKAGLAGNSLDFDGSNDYVKYANANSSLRFTANGSVSAWIKLNPAGTAGGAIFQKQSDSNSASYWEWGMKFSVGSDRKLAYSIIHTDNGAHAHNLNGAGFLSTGEWHHVAGVWESPYMTTYIDGVRDTTLNVGTGALRTGTRGPSFTGAFYDQTDTLVNYFNGAIDDLRVYSRALSGQEIQNIYNANFTNSAPAAPTGVRVI